MSVKEEFITSYPSQLWVIKRSTMKLLNYSCQWAWKCLPVGDAESRHLWLNILLSKNQYGTITGLTVSYHKLLTAQTKPTHLLTDLNTSSFLKTDFEIHLLGNLEKSLCWPWGTTADSWEITMSDLFLHHPQSHLFATLPRNWNFLCNRPQNCFPLTQQT